YDLLHLDRIPRRYTVEPGRTLTDAWDPGADGGRYDLWVYGPNGFVRSLKGQAAAALEASLRTDGAGRSLRFTLSNRGEQAVTVSVRANAYRTGWSRRITLKPGEHQETAIPLPRSHNWYDYTISSDRLQRRFAGRVETGAHDVSDPAV